MTQAVAAADEIPDALEADTEESGRGLHMRHTHPLPLPSGAWVEGTTKTTKIHQRYFGRSCRAVLDKVFNNLAGVNKIVLRDEHLDAARDCIGPHPAYIFILKRPFDTVAIQDGLEQIRLDDVAGVNDDSSCRLAWGVLDLRIYIAHNGGAGLERATRDRQELRDALGERRLVSQEIP